MKEYMVDIRLPSSPGMDVLIKYPDYRVIINFLLSIGRLASYSSSFDRSRLWITLQADSKFEVVKLLKKFPIYASMKYEIHQLTLNEHTKVLLPPVSDN
ncbi:MAG: hypothetical protein JJU28_00470 [Cyclobacteriaceae bacterium]|nr:hypothetical protein [Cyclobacteriaceae bacterium]